MPTKQEEPLQPHQQRVVNKIQRQPGLVVAHEPGAGKTRTSIEAYKALKMPMDAIVPASLKENYRKELKKWTGGVPKDVDVLSQQLIARNGYRPETTQKLMVVDEGHRGRNPETNLNKELKHGLTEKRLVLTGSPIYNHPSDISTLVNLAAGKNILPETKGAFSDHFIRKEVQGPGVLGMLLGVKPGTTEHLKNKQLLRKVLQKYVDYEPTNKETFPSSSEETIKVPMDRQQQEIYDTMLGKAPAWIRYKVKQGLPPNKAELAKLQAFLTGLRQVSNSTAPFVADKEHAVAPKAQRAVEVIKERMKNDPQFKGIVYSNFLESGLDPVQNALKNEHIPYGEFSGRVNDETRQQAVRDYNLNKLRLLLLSSAGGEGLDLKNTKLVQILEPHFNEEKEKQIIGRAIRLGSHADLPPEQRHVDIQRYISTLPDPQGFHKLIQRKAPGSVDEYINTLAQQKTQLNNELYELLRMNRAAEVPPSEDQ